jgi:hypothetical protein
MNATKGALAEDGDWEVDGNVYYALPDEKAFNGTTFAEYRKATGFDGSSKLLAPVNGRPAGTRVFVRPNRYEKGRAHVAVLNWDGVRAVKVDLSGIGLEVGAKFQVRNVPDLFGPPGVEGVYRGREGAVPTLRSPIAPHFDAFLVIPEASFGCFATRGDEPRPDWRKHDWSRLHWGRAE